MLFDDLPPQLLTPDKARRQTKYELQAAAYDAIRTLRAALYRDDFPLSKVRAAVAILDRAGFGPHASLAIASDQTRDFTDMSVQELRARAASIANEVHERIMTQTAEEDSDKPVH